MPRRAAPGDKLEIEAILSIEELGTLADTCRLLGVPKERWQRIPALEASYTTLAALRLAERLRIRQGMPWERSIDMAAIRLKLPPDTIHTRVTRWVTYAFAPSSCDA